MFSYEEVIFFMKYISSVQWGDIFTPLYDYKYIF